MPRLLADPRMKNLAFALLALFALGALVGGCTDAADDEVVLPELSGGKADGDALFVDQRSGDVTILQAWAGDMYCRGTWCRHPLDVALCDGADCGKAVREAARLDSIASPLANRFEFSESAASCSAIELRALIRKEAFEAPTFHGIGFAMNGTNCGDPYRFAPEGQFVPKSELHRVGVEVALAGGGTGYVLRFLAKRNCAFGGDSGSLSRYGKMFRPFAQFRVEEARGTVFYNNWDNVESDYKLGCVGTSTSAGSPYIRVESFDRQGELLAQ